MPNIVDFKYTFNLIDGERTEIKINDEIASKKSIDWWTGEKGSEVTPKDFIEQLDNSNSKYFDVVFNSCGGEVFCAQEIATAIKKKRQSGCKFTAKIESICASAAVQIALACDEVQITKGGYIMIHDPMTFYFGYINIVEAKEVIDRLEVIKNGIVAEYAEKTKIAKDEITSMMEKTTWLYGEDAVEKGFADSLMLADEEEEEEIENKIFDTLRNMNHGKIAASLKLPKALESVLNKKETKQSRKEETKMEIKTVQDLRTAYPALTNQLEQDAIANYTAENPVNEAVEKERNRIKALDNMAGKVSPELIDKAKYETFATANDVALEAINSGALIQNGVLDALKEEGKDTKDVAGTVPPEGGAGDEKKAATDKAANIAKNFFEKTGKVK